MLECLPRTWENTIQFAAPSQTSLRTSSLYLQVFGRLTPTKIHKYFDEDCGVILCISSVLHQMNCTLFFQGAVVCRASQKPYGESPFKEHFLPLWVTKSPRNAICRCPVAAD